MGNAEASSAAILSLPLELMRRKQDLVKALSTSTVASVRMRLQNIQCRQVKNLKYC